MVVNVYVPSLEENCALYYTLQRANWICEFYERKLSTSPLCYEHRRVRFLGPVEHMLALIILSCDIFQINSPNVARNLILRHS